MVQYMKHRAVFAAKQRKQAGHMGFRIGVAARAARCGAVGHMHLHVDHQKGRRHRLCPHIIALANLNPVVAQDVVGGGGVEMKLRRGVGGQKGSAGQRHIGGAGFERDRPRCSIVIGTGRKAGHISAGGGDAGQQFSECRFGIGKALGGFASQTGGTAGGKIASQLNLLGEGQHIGEQPEIQQGFGLDVFRHAMRLGLGQDVGQRTKGAVHWGDDLGMHAGDFLKVKVDACCIMGRVIPARTGRWVRKMFGENSSGGGRLADEAVVSLCVGC